MRSKVIVIGKRKYVIIFYFIFCILILSLVILSKNKFPEDTTEEISSFNKSYLEVCYNSSKNDIKGKDLNVTKETANIINNKLEVKEIDGIEVIGKLEIPKINLNTYILAETSKESLNKSITKLCGPKVNGVGNLCITGHNYNNNKMFGKLDKVKIDDKIYLTGTNGNRLEYVVYDIYKVYPKDLECLSQETNGQREITLITCTTGAIKRLIVKATEVYD